MGPRALTSLTNRIVFCTPIERDTLILAYDR